MTAHGAMSPDGHAPADTVTVFGGAGATAVESDSVRRAAARMADAAQYLRAAAVRCTAASGGPVLPGATFAGSLPPLLAPGAAPPALGSWPAGGAGWATAAGLTPAARALETAAQDAARCLTARADMCDLLGWRLLRAAGLYEEAESAAERVVGALVTAGTFGLGSALAGLGWAGLAGLGVVGGAEAGGRLVGGALMGGASSAITGWSAATATRALAPFSDEAFTGLGSGVALARPGLADGRTGVAGGAGVLAHVAREIPIVGNDAHGVRVTRLGPEDFAGGAEPDWAASGAGSVQQALTRVDSLYPGKGGAPVATVAVQRVTGADGEVSWTVLVPGTQSALAADHPWDGRTDLELVAGQADAATAAIERALADSGVGPDEPVTFVGHSLGGIAAAVLVSRPGFAERYRVAGLVTAGAPTGTLGTPPGVPVLHLETPEEVVTSSDGRSGAENPRTRDRVTVVRSLGESAAAADRAASGSVAQAHSVSTHVRTLDLAIGSGDPRVTELADRIGARLDGAVVTTAFYRADRVSR